MDFWGNLYRKPCVEHPAVVVNRDPAARLSYAFESLDLGIRDEGHRVSFLMRDGTRPIRCYVLQSALDTIGQLKTSCADERIARFDQHRAKFEAVASELYDAGLPLLITADHVTLLQGS